MEAKMWQQGSGSEDLVATIWKLRSGSEYDEKVMVLESKILQKTNQFHIGCVDIRLENVGVPATRVVDIPSRSGLTLVQKRRCL